MGGERDGKEDGWMVGLEGTLQNRSASSSTTAASSSPVPDKHSRRSGEMGRGRETGRQREIDDAVHSN